MKVSVILGTRPELIKMQPVIREILDRSSFEFVFVHTGQHYDWNMSSVFIEELELPEPDMFLNVKSGSQGSQTARIIARSEKVLKKERPDVILVQGDTNSALGAAIAASKLKLKIGHVEAGCRSFDKDMPEEINRVLIADLASFDFAPTRTCVENLLREGVEESQIHLTGHPIVDILIRIGDKITIDVLEKLALRPKEYYFVTVHREENVENRIKLGNMLEALSAVARSRPMVFPMHPHTHKSVRKFGVKSSLKNVSIIEPLGYLETLSLIKHARIVLTDSGGIQQEAALLGTPCVTLRARTEWVETVDCGVNFLADSKEDIIATVSSVESRYEKILKRFDSAHNIFGEPHVAARIVDVLEASDG